MKKYYFAGIVSSVLFFLLVMPSAYAAEDTGETTAPLSGGTVQIIVHTTGTQTNNIFGFDSNLGVSSVTTSGSSGVGSGSETRSILPGNYFAQPIAIQALGWQFTNAICSDRAINTNVVSPGSINVLQGSNIECIFNFIWQGANPTTGTLVVNKDRGGGPDGVFNFIGNTSIGGLIIPTEFASFSLSPANSYTETFSLPAGVYSLEESIIPVDWTRSGVSCVDDVTGTTTTDFNNIDVKSGHVITCTFFNTYATSSNPGTLMIVKYATGGNGVFNFTLTGTVKSNGTAVAKNTFINTAIYSAASLEVEPGTYSVAETFAEAGWTATDVGCSQLSNVATINGTNGSKVDGVVITPGSIVICAFYNTKTSTPGGNIVVHKNAIGGTGTFSFATYSSQPAIPFSINTAVDSTHTLTGLNISVSWSVYETGIPQGWVETSNTCVGLGFTAPGQTLHCTITNTYSPVSPTSWIHIVKKTKAGDDGYFTFDVYADSSKAQKIDSFSIQTTNGEGTYDLAVTPGQPYPYIEESNDPNVWEVTGLSCTDPNGAPLCIQSAQGGVSTCTVTIGMTAKVNETIACEFENTGYSRINVIKETSSGDDGTFSFDVYTDSAMTNKIDSFNITTTGGSGAHILDVPSGQPYPYIAETVPSGWKLSNIFCLDSTGAPICAPTIVNGVAQCINFTHQTVAGDLVNCTFQNTKTTTSSNSFIHVVKKTIGGDATFPFNVYTDSSMTTKIGGFNIATNAGSGVIINDLPVTAGQPYPYIAEDLSAMPGWKISDLMCLDPDGTPLCTPSFDANGNATCINFKHVAQPNATISCTFTNKKDVVPPNSGTLRIYKNIGTASGVGVNFNFGISGASSSSASVNMDPVVHKYWVDVPLSAGIYNIKESGPANWGLTGVACHPDNDVTSPFDVNSQFTGTPSIGSTNDISGVAVKAGEVTFCVFVNIFSPVSANGSLQIIKYAVGGNPANPPTFDYMIGTSPAQVALSGSYGSTNITLFPGTYDVKEDPLSGWKLDPSNPPYCTDANGNPTGTFDGVSTVKNVSILQGATGSAGCFFNNMVTTTGGGKGTLKIVKNSTGGNGTFTFSLGKTGMADIFTAVNVTTTTGTGSTTQSLDAGTYYIQEDYTPAFNGWQFLSMECRKQDGTITGTTPFYSGGDSKVGVVIVADQTTTCIYQNKKVVTTGSGFLKFVKKVVSGPDATFTIGGVLESDTSKSVTANVTTLNGVGATGSLTAPAGTYTIGEARPDNTWHVSTSSCTLEDGSPTGTAGPIPDAQITGILVEPGKVTTCTFNNKKDGVVSNKGALQIIKNATGGDATFHYDITSPQTLLDIPTVQGSGVKSLDLNAGTYSITEGALAGWNLTGASCKIQPLSTSGASCDQLVDEQSCIDNTSPSCQWSITGSTYDRCQDAYGLHSYAGDHPDATTCNADTANNCSWSCGASPVSSFGHCFNTNCESYATGDLDPGCYGGWGTSFGCKNNSFQPTYTYACIESGSQSSGTNTGNLSGTTIGGVEIKAGQTTVCTFDNTKVVANGATALVIKKKANGGDDTFFFAVALNNSNGGTYYNTALNITTSNGSGSLTPISVTPDDLTSPTPFAIQEAGLADWDHVSFSCDKGTFDVAPIDQSTPHPNIDVTGTIPPGETTTCTFENTKVAGTAKMIIVKNAIGGDGTDTFSFNLYDNTGVSTTPSATFDITADTEDTSSTNPGASIKYTGTHELLFNEGDPWPYIEEVDEPGWGLDLLGCFDQDGDPTCTMGTDPDGNPVCLGDIGATAEANDVVTCTFENTKTVAPTLTIVKNAIGGDGTESFHIDLFEQSLVSVQPYSPASLDIKTDKVDPDNPQIFNGSTKLTLGIGDPYPFMLETIPTGWTLTAVTCVDEAGQEVCTQDIDANGNPMCTSSASAESGDQITCTFENTKDGFDGGTGSEEPGDEPVDIPDPDIEIFPFFQ